MRSARARAPAAVSAAGPRCSHRFERVRVGNYQVGAGGLMYVRNVRDFQGADVVVPLTPEYSSKFNLEEYKVIPLILRDFGGVPTDWEAVLKHIIIPELKDGKTLYTFCIGSHGRTGTFLASLIALLESRHTTPDPIAAVRERHCSHAVETIHQAEAIFALRDEPLPSRYARV